MRDPAALRALFPGCLIPRDDGAILSLEQKEATWGMFVTGAPCTVTPLSFLWQTMKGVVALNLWVLIKQIAVCRIKRPTRPLSCM